MKALRSSNFYMVIATFFFSELFRVLKPGGRLIDVDWMHSSSDYSDLMKTFVLEDGLSFHLCTIKECLNFISHAGFVDIISQETSRAALKHSQADVDKLLDPKISAAFKEKFGEAAYSQWLASWKMQCEIFEKGEMQTFLIEANKP